MRLPIDFEHQTLPEHNRRADGKAPAAGWIDSLEYVPGVGLRANVSWTDEALGDIRGGKYRYLSPVVMVEEESHRIVALHSAGLTNKPAIPNFPELLAAKQGVDVSTLVLAEEDPSTPPVQDESAGLKRLATLLGLSADAAMPAVLEAAIAFVNQAKGESQTGETLANRVRECYGMDARTTVEALVTKLDGRKDLLTNAQLHAAKLDEQLGDERRRAKGLQDKLDERELHACIDGYTRQGKLTRSMELAALEEFTSTPLPFDKKLAAFKKRMDAQPVVIPQGQTKWSGETTPEQGQRREICRQAASDYGANPSVQRMCSRTAFVNNALREEGLEALSKDEQSTFEHGS